MEDNLKGLMPFTIGEMHLLQIPLTNKSRITVYIERCSVYHSNLYLYDDKNTLMAVIKDLGVKPSQLTQSTHIPHQLGVI